MATIEQYLLTNCNRFHPLLGRLFHFVPRDYKIYSNNAVNNYYIAERNQGLVMVFPENGLMIINDDFLSKLKVTIKIGTLSLSLYPAYIQRLDEDGVVFARGDTILFYKDSRWYVRFDGIPETPSNTIFKDYDDNEHMVGVPYIRCGTGDIPTILGGERVEIDCSNFLEPDDREKECKLIIDPEDIGYYRKVRGTTIEGIYEGRLAYKGKRFRVGIAIWSHSGVLYLETGKENGRIQVSGITYDASTNKYIWGAKDDPNGWYEFDGDIEFEKEIIFKFARLPDSDIEMKEDEVFSWYGFKIYDKNKRPYRTAMRYVVESPTWR